jgi:hypothetical protein
VDILALGVIGLFYLLAVNPLIGSFFSDRKCQSYLEDQKTGLLAHLFFGGLAGSIFSIVWAASHLMGK